MYVCRNLLIAAAVLLTISSPARSQQDGLKECSRLEGRDWDTKIAGCTRLLREHPNSGAVYNGRGFWYHQKGEHDLAIADYTKAITLEPLDKSKASIYSNRGNSFFAKGELERALADHEQAVALDPGNGGVFNNRASTLREMGRLNAALSDYDQAIKLMPNLPTAYGGRGLVHRAKGDLDAALADFDRILRINPKDVQAHTGRGLVYEERGDFQRARTDYELASKLPLPAVIDKERLYLDADPTRYRNTARVRLKVLSGPQKERANLSVDGAERRVALVIGNSGYTSVNALPNPTNDARLIANTLRQVGFTVTESVDLNGEAMRGVVRDFLLASTGARIAVVFYAGHGVQIDGRNYLVPIDAQVADKDNVETNLAELDNILAGLDDQIRTNIVILDACRDNPFAQEITRQVGSSRSIVRSGLALQGSPGKGATVGAGTLIAFSTAPGEVALDGVGDNSPFSRALARHLSATGLEVQQVFTRVRAEVVAATHGGQIPWSSSSLLGEVYLAGK